MISLDLIASTENLEELFYKLIKNTDTIKKIRNFGPLKYEDVEPFLEDPKIILELEKFGRKSILKRYYEEKNNSKAKRN